MAPRVEIRALGPLALREAGAPEWAPWPGRPGSGACRVLHAVCLSGPGGMPAARAAAIAGVSEAAARRALQRAPLPDGALGSAGSYALNPAVACTDLHDLAGLCGRAVAAAIEGRAAAVQECLGAAEALLGCDPGSAGLPCMPRGLPGMLGMLALAGAGHLGPNAQAWEARSRRAGWALPG